MNKRHTSSVFYNPAPILDGNSQYFAGGANIQITTENFCISGWVKRDGIPNSSEILLQKYSAQGYAVYIPHTSGRIALYIDDASGSSTSPDGASICDNKWHHFAVTCDRDGNMLMYLDGTLYGSAMNISTRALTLTNAGNFNVGANSAASDGWLEGGLKYIRIYIHATGLWTAADVATLYKKSKNPTVVAVTHAWDFDEAVGATSILDKVGSVDLTPIDGGSVTYGNCGRSMVQFP